MVCARWSEKPQENVRLVLFRPRFRSTFRAPKSIGLMDKKNLQNYEYAAEDKQVESSALQAEDSWVRAPPAVPCSVGPIGKAVTLSR